MIDAIKLVEELNYEFYEISGNEEWCPFTLKTTGIGYVILFCSWPVFQSENDSLEDGITELQHVMKQANLMIDQLEFLRYFIY